MNIFTESPYQNVIDFIDVAVDSDELMNWLSNLENLSDNLRSDHPARMKAKMLSNKEPEKIINTMGEHLNSMLGDCPRIGSGCHSRDWSLPRT